MCVEHHAKLLGRILPGNMNCPATMELSSIGIVVQRFICNIPGLDKYVIMPNHVHFTVRLCQSKDGTMWASSPTQSVPQLVKSLKTLVSKTLGQSIWQRGYYDRIVRNQEEYLRIWNYMDTNPAKWAEDKYFTP